MSILLSRILLPASLALLLGACIERGSDSRPESTSLLIANAVIVDGTGVTKVLGAVRIVGDTIIDVGDLEQVPGEQLIDADGLVLAPGFIDTHSHHDEGLADNREGLPLLTQGITTAVFGQDGFHSLPLDAFLNAFSDAPAAINIGAFVGHDTLRAHVMGDDFKREANLAEISAMRELLIEELDSGALGLSTGLEYEPGIYSSAEEVLTLAQATADRGGRYISHIRSEDRYLWDAVEEIIAIGRETGMPVQISHIKLAAKGLWGQADKLLERLDHARAEGINITADVYPYEYWQSTMWVLLPDRNADDLEEIAYVLEELTPADGIIFTRFEPEPSYVNKSVADISRVRGTGEAETFSALLKEARAWSEAHAGQSAESIMGRSMSEDDIQTFLAWPQVNICTDGGFTGHPRGHGAFPRVLARYVRERGILSLENAVAAMTSRAAEHLGIKNRGRIAPGFKADLVLFDPQTIRDNASIRNGQVLSSGVAGVWVNGERVLNNEGFTGVFPGSVLKRD
ncbi:MAG: amidohydrolase family protein [Congregibacter sp.]